MRIHPSHRPLLFLAAIALVIQACHYNYAVPSDDASIRFPCRYAGCEDDAFQFYTPLYRQRPDTALGHGLVELELKHLQRPPAQPELGLVSTIELETFDSLVTIDVASIVLQHRRLDGSLIVPVRTAVDSNSQCEGCTFYLRRIRLRHFYGEQLPKQLSEEVAVDLLVRGRRVPIRADFRNLSYRRHYTFWDILMGV